MKGVRGGYRKNNTSHTEKYQAHILAVLVTKLFALMINLANQLFFTEEKMWLIDSLKQFLGSMIIFEK